MAISKSTPLPLPSRNPLPLSAAQEAQVRELYYKRVRTYCADEIRGKYQPRRFPRFKAFPNFKLADFASCALNRTFSATWVCRQQRLAMNSCMVSHATKKSKTQLGRSGLHLKISGYRRGRQRRGGSRSRRNFTGSGGVLIISLARIGTRNEIRDRFQGT